MLNLSHSHKNFVFLFQLSCYISCLDWLLAGCVNAHWASSIMALLGVSHTLFISCLVLFATQAACWNLNTTEHQYTIEFDTCEAKCLVLPGIYQFYVKGQGHLDSYLLNCHLLSTTNAPASVCNVELGILDEFVKYPSRSQNQSVDYPSSVLALTLNCTYSKQKMRVKISNAQGIEHTDVISMLSIYNCGVIWSDIDVFAKAFDLWYLEFSPCNELLYRNHTHLQKLGVLSLTGQFGVTSIPPVLLESKWNGMGGLTLNNMTLKSFPDLQLSHAMPHLQKLSLENNMLTIPPDFPWDNRRLELPRNLSIREDLCRGSFGYRCLSSTLPGDIYQRALILDHNNISDLSSHSFKGWLNLLSLRGNGLKLINPKCFHNLTDLQILDLGQNKLKYIPSELFVIHQDKDTLVNINLSYNAIISISPSHFQMQKTLTQIDLSHNELYIIRKGTFSHLKMLEVIILNNNKLNHIEKGSFSEDMIHLRHIDFSKNNLKKPPVCLFYLITLETALVQMNMIDFYGLCQALDDSILPKISEINHLKRSKKKVVINLSSNNISHLNVQEMTSQQLFKFTFILTYIELDLTDNPLYCDCKTTYLFLYLQGLMKQLLDVAHFYRTWRCINLNNSPILNLRYYDFQCPLKRQGCPKECICKQTLYHAISVYCQDRNLTQLPASMPNGTEFLFLNRNQISLIDGKPYLSRLRSLDMSDNYLTFISPKALHMLQGAIVDLDRNKLTALPPDIQTMNFSALFLAHNVWKCDCHTIWMKNWLLSSSSFIKHSDHIVCSSGGDPGVPIVYVADEKFVCGPLLKAGEIAGIVASCCLLLLIISLLLVYKFSTKIKIMLYTRFNWHPFDRFNIDDDPRKTHDIFIAYCGEDCDWVYDVLIEGLENVHDPPYKTLVHARDFDAGVPIVQSIYQSVDRCKRIVMVLSESFIRSHWCMLEFRTAHERVITEHNNYIIMIMLEDITGLELDETLRAYINTHTYLSYDDKWFWKKLYYALPPVVVQEDPEHPPVEVREEPEEMRQRNNGYARF